MAKPRILARPGQSLAEVNAGRLVTYQEDVLGIKSRIESEFRGAIKVFFDKDPSALCWVITQTDINGTESILFTTRRLSESSIERVRRADQAAGRRTAFLEDIEREEKQIERDEDHAFGERIGPINEQLYFALRRDGAIHRPTVFMANSHKRRRGMS